MEIPMQFRNTPRLILSAAALAALAMPVTSALAEPGHNGDAAHAEQKAEYVGDPYPLATDPVTGEKLADDAITHVHEQRQLRFNSEKNVETFTADPAKYLKAVDAKLVEMQKEHYPLKTCPVSGGELGSMGEPIDIIVGNRLVRLCCAGCEKQVRDNPTPVIEKLDAAVIEQQSADYEATVCPVSGDKLGGAMGDPVNYVIAHRLVKLCCAGCVGMVEENPAAVLAKLDGEANATDGKKADDGHTGHDH
jgi:YHS domain-containing protein